MLDLENFYLKLPITLQNFVCSLEGLRIQYKRFGGELPKLLKEAEERSFWPIEKIISYRNQQLAKFVKHSVETVPFYKELFRKLKISPDDIKTLDDLTKLPILTKKDVQENYSKLISATIPKKQQIVSHTSGTTGGGLKFATTMQSIQQQWAIWLRYRRWHGLENNIWCGYFGGRSVVSLSQAKPPYWRFNYPGKQILFSAYHINREHLNYYLDVLKNKQPPWLHGYPSLIVLLANHLLETNNHLPYKVKWITTGAENLLSQQSKLIEKAFGVKPKQHYGMAEAVANFSECEFGNLHVDEDFAATEFILTSNGSYKVVGTNFTNFATPLLRYDTEDLVSFWDERCCCKRPGRVVKNVDGRKEDYIVLKNGSYLGRMDHIFKDLVNVREAQIYQRHIGEITIRIVAGKNYQSDDELALLTEAKKRVGDDTKINIEYFEKLERSKTGKLRFVISEIEKAKIENV